MSDVVIVGGGPAGCATALSLRAHAPALTVALVEASDYDAPRIGETLPPAATRIIDHLGVAEQFARQGHRQSYGTGSAWGTPALGDNDFLFSARGHGWHLDRAAFDSMLAAEAEARGVHVLRATRVTRARRRSEKWHITLSAGHELTSRFLVDATGSAAAIARQCGAGSLASDRLVAFARFFPDSLDGDPRTLVEAFADGWWYTAPLPGGTRIAACMTDGDIARRLSLADPAHWGECLAGAGSIAAAVRGAAPYGEIVVRSARSRRLEPAAGDGWLAVGDAASTFDPLSSQGIAKALRSGVFASYAIGDLLVNGDESGVARYRWFVADDFESYLAARDRYYAAERRWPNSEFWRRRQSRDAVIPQRHDLDLSNHLSLLVGQ